MARLISASGIALFMTLAMATAMAQTSPTATGALCNTDGTSANVAFSTTSTTRVITTNMCPNHAVRTINPNAARQNSFFGVSNQQYSVPLKPQLASTANIINVTCIPGPIGFTRSGAVIFSVYAATYCGDDAVKLESKTFDECNGHSKQSGMYHYHMTPGCTLLTSGYVSTAHSPILGYMLDGIPIYGPLSDKGALPTDLDSCGGHSSDSGNNGQYHYHMKPVTGSWPDPSTPTTSTTSIGAGWPYTPGCLRGCVDSPYLNFLSGQGVTKYTTYAACTASGGTVLSNVESITSATATPTPPTTTSASSATTTVAPVTLSPSSASAVSLLGAVAVAMMAFWSF